MEHEKKMHNMEHEKKMPVINFKIDDLVSTYLFILYRAKIKVKEVTFLEVERFGALLKEAYKEKGELVFDLRRDLTREFLSNHMDLLKIISIYQKKRPNL